MANRPPAQTVAQLKRWLRVIRAAFHQKIEEVHRLVVLTRFGAKQIHRFTKLGVGAPILQVRCLNTDAGAEFVIPHLIDGADPGTRQLKLLRKSAAAAAEEAARTVGEPLGAHARSEASHHRRKTLGRELTSLLEPILDQLKRLERRQHVDRTDRVPPHNGVILRRQMTRTPPIR